MRLNVVQFTSYALLIFFHILLCSDRSEKDREQAISKGRHEDRHHKERERREKEEKREKGRESSKHEAPKDRSRSRREEQVEEKREGEWSQE